MSKEEIRNKIEARVLVVVHDYHPEFIDADIYNVSLINLIKSDIDMALILFELEDIFDILLDDFNNDSYDLTLEEFIDWVENRIPPAETTDNR